MSDMFVIAIGFVVGYCMGLFTLKMLLPKTFTITAKEIHFKGFKTDSIRGVPKT